MMDLQQMPMLVQVPYTLIEGAPGVDEIGDSVHLAWRMYYEDLDNRAKTEGWLPRKDEREDWPNLPPAHML